MIDSDERDAGKYWQRIADHFGWKLWCYVHYAWATFSIQELAPDYRFTVQAPVADALMYLVGSRRER